MASRQSFQVIFHVEEDSIEGANEWKDRAKAVRLHLAGHAVDEIMQVHGWTYQKARNLIARGMSDLRDALRKGGYAEPPSLAA